MRDPLDHGRGLPGGVPAVIGWRDTAGSVSPELWDFGPSVVHPHRITQAKGSAQLPPVGTTTNQATGVLRGLPLSSLAACPTPEWCLSPKSPQELENASCQPPKQVWDTPIAGNKPFLDNLSEFSRRPPLQFKHSLFSVSLQNQN